MFSKSQFSLIAVLVLIASLLPNIVQARPGYPALGAATCSKDVKSIVVGLQINSVNPFTRVMSITTYSFRICNPLTGEFDLINENGSTLIGVPREDGTIDNLEIKVSSPVLRYNVPILNVSGDGVRHPMNEKTLFLIATNVARYHGILQMNVRLDVRNINTQKHTATYLQTDSVTLH
jgi:hypothetical protein